MPSATIIRTDDLRNQNRRRVLDTLRVEGSCSPARLRQLTGLSAASVSTLCSRMIDQGILNSERSPAEQSRSLRGRPRTLLSLRPAAGHVLTVILTIDCIKVHLVDYAGCVCDTREKHLDTRKLSTEQLLSAVCSGVDELRDAHTQVRMLHIGVGFQGQTENATGVLLWSPIIREQNVPLGDTLRSRYGVSVSVHNDCRLIAQALHRSHASLLGNNFATVLFSHGVGLGLYLNARPFAGIRSSAMEIGHMRYESDGALCRCGRRGCIEAYAADYGIERMMSGLPLDHKPAGRVSDASMDALIAKAQAGDKPALQAFTIAGRAVGTGLVNLFTLLDPMPVALVGHSDSAFALMSRGMHDVLADHLKNGPDPSTLLHCFNHGAPLLFQGLMEDSLSQIDRLFADQNTEIYLNG